MWVLNMWVPTHAFNFCKLVFLRVGKLNAWVYNVGMKLKAPNFPEDSDAAIRAYIKRKYAPSEGRGVRFFAEKLGVSVGTAHSYLKNVLGYLQQQEEVTVKDRRRCQVCKKDKQLTTQFPKDPSHSRGYGYVCKTCLKDRRAKHGGKEST